MPLGVGRLIPKHQTSAPQVATGMMRASTALTSAPGATLWVEEFMRRMQGANFTAFPYQVVT